MPSAAKKAKQAARKPGVKPTSKAVAKPAAKPATKPAAKPTTKPAAKPAAKKAPAKRKRDEDTSALGRPQKARKVGNAVPGEGDVDSEEAGMLSSFDSNELVEVQERNDDEEEEEYEEDEEYEECEEDYESASAVSSGEQVIVGDTDSSDPYALETDEEEEENSVPLGSPPIATTDEKKVKFGTTQVHDPPAQTELEAVQEIMQRFTGDDDAQVKGKDTATADVRTISVLQQQALGVTAVPEGKLTAASLRVPATIVSCCAAAQLSAPKLERLHHLFAQANEREKECLRTMYPQYLRQGAVETENSWSHEQPIAQSPHTHPRQSPPQI